MTNEQQPLLVPKTVIHDRDLAYDMAKAEKPHRELAAQAMDAADEAATTAGLEHADQLQSHVDSLREQVATGKEKTESDSVLDLLSPEQRKKAKEVTTSMAEKFDVPETDFGVVVSETDDAKLLTELHTFGKLSGRG